MLECIVNISEGRRRNVIDSIASAAGNDLLDIHTDGDHNRCVLTLIGEEAPRAVAMEAVGRLDLRRHLGVHPRIGVIDVVPFVPLEGSTLQNALDARTLFARWIADELSVPAFLYGIGCPTLPEIRRNAYGSFRPDFGPMLPHPTAGAVAVGARHPLVAYNVWLAEPQLDLARAIVSELRGPSIRALALQVGDSVQVSMNLVDPMVVGPDEAYDRIAARTRIARAELVGLVPKALVERVSPERWNELDLDLDRTIEARLGASSG